MRGFARRYDIDLAASPPLETYRTFGQFFARPLLPGLRPIAPGDDVVVSPVDARVSEAGLAVGGRLIQAKGIDYTVAALLGRRRAGAAPRGRGLDHALPLAAGLPPHPLPARRRASPAGATSPGSSGRSTPPRSRNVPGLFTVNERLVTLLDSPLGLVAIVAVGATVVGRVRASYDAAVPVTDQPGARAMQRGDYAPPRPVEKGAELGAFEMGSTVILVFEPGRVRLSERLTPGARVRVGEPIGASGRLQGAREHRRSTP